MIGSLFCDRLDDAPDPNPRALARITTGRQHRDARLARRQHLRNIRNRRRRYLARVDRRNRVAQLLALRRHARACDHDFSSGSPSPSGICWPPRSPTAAPSTVASALLVANQLRGHCCADRPARFAAGSDRPASLMLPMPVGGMKTCTPARGRLVAASTTRPVILPSAVVR